MNREESLKLARYEETPYYFKRLINKIYDDFEKDLKDINNQVSRLKKQLSKGHHIECSCSFCKPVYTQSKEDLEDLEDYNKMVKVGINAN